MTEHIVPDIQLRFTPWEHVAAYERLRREAAHQLTQAQTIDDQRDAQQWIDSADRQLVRWQAIVARLAVQV